jgi:hypothetical protein
MNKTIYCLLLAAAFLTSGCKKKTPPPPSAPAHPSVPVALATPQQAATATRASGPESEAVNKALAMYVPLNGYPTDLNILVDGKVVTKLPTPPPGKKFGIDQAKMQLILLNE